MVEAAELRALKAQIKPHFLFNTLNGIVELIECDPKRAILVTQALSDLFRYTLAASQRDTLLLSEELNHIHQYLAIQQIRFDDRLDVRWKIDKRLESCLVPPMILQPLVENAIHYGCDQDGNVRITVDVHTEEREVVIRIADEGARKVPHSQLYNGKGTGIRNVDDRLSAFLGRRLLFEDNIPDGLCAVIRIPQRTS
jgi:sensor histidine kinase YesM